jgi:flagellar biosynthesis/type III secretory pathway protein FliH
MAEVINTDDYAWGYDQGLRDGRDEGYTDGWQDCSKNYGDRIADLQTKVLTLEAALAVFNRKG